MTVRLLSFDDTVYICIVMPASVGAARVVSGLFMCGPCPVVAVLNGKVELDYDTAFVYAEVNADVKIWKSMGQGSWQLVNTDTTQ